MKDQSEQKLFTDEELGQARWHLQDAGFPLSSDAAELQLLSTPEPFFTYTFAAHAILTAFEENADSERLHTATHRCAELLDRIETVVTRSQSIPVACKRGCFYCCSLRVTVLAPEALRIARYIDEKLEPKLRDHVNSAVDRFTLNARGLTPMQRFRKPLLCPLNKDGDCLVYEVRPAGCRIHHSYSVEQCANAYENWETEQPVTRSAMRKLCGDAVTLAFSDVLDFLELDPRSFELVESVKIALSGASPYHDYLAGDATFDDAYLQEVHDIADAAL